MRFIEKLRLKIKETKQGGKILFFLPLLLKVICALFLSVFAPLVIFLLFISVEPREISAINNYLYETIKNKTGEEIEEIKSAKISFDSNFSLYYSVGNTILKNENYQISVGEMIIRLSPFRLFSSRSDIVRRVEFADVDATFNISEAVELKGGGKTFEIMFEHFLKVLRSKRIFLANSFHVKNGKFTVKNLLNNTSDTFLTTGATLKIRKNKNEIEARFTINTKINDKNTIKSENSCIVNNKLENLQCDFNFDGISMNDIVNLSKNNNKHIAEYSKNIIGKFDLRMSFNVSKTEGIKSLDFLITSEKGVLKLRKLFGGTIDYQNLSIKGTVKNNGDNIGCDEISALISTKKDSKYNKLEGNVFFNKEDNISTTIKLSDNDAKNLDILWPIFLDQLDIREWVIENVKSGQISDLYTYLNFVFTNNEYELDKVDASFKFKNTVLDYDKDFPALSGMEGIAFFSENDMKIRIDSAESFGTKFTNGEIYIDFNAEKTYLDIKAHSYGDTYYLGYYINYENKDGTKDIIDNFFNGFAQSSVDLKIPIEDMDSFDIFKLSQINVQSELTKNNNLIFKDNSSSYLTLSKPVNSSVFDIKVDLTKSRVEFDAIDLVKKKGEKGTVAMTLAVNKNNVLLENIRLLHNKNIDFRGNGVIEDDVLKSLTINDIKYNDSLYNLEIIFNNSENVDVILNANSMKINLAKNKTFNTDYYEIFRGISNVNINFFGAIKKLKTEGYEFDDMTFNFKYNDGDIDKLNIKNDFLSVSLNNERKNEQFSIDLYIKNIGKFLYDANIMKNMVGGNLYGKLTLDENGKIVTKLKITDNFEIVTKNMKQADFYRYLLDSKDVSDKIKKELLKNNAMAFSKMEANLEIKNNLVKIERFLFKSGEDVGMGLSGFGAYDLASGNTKIDGVIIPLDKINTVFGMNKIPVINNLLFKNKDGGLVTVDYKLKRDSHNDDYDFKIIPSSIASPNFLKNIALLFLLL